MPIVAHPAAPARLRPSHLKRLEAESIGIMREVVAEGLGVPLISESGLREANIGKGSFGRK